MRRWMPWALAASLALNLAVAGAVIGAVVAGGPRGAERLGRGPEALIARALPRSERRALRAALGREGGRSPDPAPLLDALRASPFDADAFAAALGRRAAARAARAERGIAALAQAVGRLSDEERARLAAGLAARRGPPR